MKVLIVHHQMALYGGAELVVTRLAHHLQKRGHVVRILAANTILRPEYKDLDIVTPPKETQWHLWNGTASSLLEIYHVFAGLKKLCAEYADEFDVINTHNFPTVWAAPSKKKIVWLCNEIPDLWHSDGIPGLINQVLNTGRLADRLIARSKHPTAVVPDARQAQRFQHRYGFFPEIIPYGIDGEFFSEKVNADRYSRFTVIQPSMISPSKNQMEVLEVIQNMDVDVIFAGYYETTHPYTKRLMQRSAGLNVTLTGHIGKVELRTLYHTAHVAVFPGRGQGSWLGPFEALATGVPIIVSPNLSCSELIHQHKLGTVTDNLTDAIREVYKHYSEYRQQALKGREFVLRELTWDKFGDRMMELMQ